MFPSGPAQPSSPAAAPARPAAPPMSSSGPADEDQLARALGLPRGMKVPPETLQLALAGKLGPEVQKVAQSSSGQPPQDGQQQAPAPDADPTKPKIGASSIFGRGAQPPADGGMPAPDDDDDDQTQGPMKANSIFGRR